MRRQHVLVPVAAFLLAFPAMAAVRLPWSSTFDCAEWHQSAEGTNNLQCDGMTEAGPLSACPAGETTQITSAANNPEGGGGRGVRYWLGDGKNNQTEVLDLTWDTPVQELWGRYYARWQSGFTWSDNRPYGTKELYFRYYNAGNRYPGNIVGFHWGYFAMVIQGTGFRDREEAYHSSLKWSDIMEGSAGDGKWPCYEFHMKYGPEGQGIVELWVDNEQVLNKTDATFVTSEGWVGTRIKSNNDSPANGGCRYVDFDDVAFSTTGRIGPIGGRRK